MIGFWSCLVSFFAVPSSKANAHQEALFRDISFLIYCAHSRNESVQYRSLQERSLASAIALRSAGAYNSSAIPLCRPVRSTGTAVHRDLKPDPSLSFRRRAQRAVREARNADGQAP
jgi:hypothetical protein